MMKSISWNPKFNSLNFTNDSIISTPSFHFPSQQTSQNTLRLKMLYCFPTYSSAVEWHYDDVFFASMEQCHGEFPSSPHNFELIKLREAFSLIVNFSIYSWTAIFYTMAIVGPAMGLWWIWNDLKTILMSFRLQVMSLDRSCCCFILISFRWIL